MVFAPRDPALTNLAHRGRGEPSVTDPEQDKKPSDAVLFDLLAVWVPNEARIGR
jgi:hypothetical protein